MINEFVQAWNTRKNILKRELEKSKELKTCDYDYLVQLLFDIVLNKSIYVYEKFDKFNIDKMTVIDDGDYQGEKIFLIPYDTYQPSVCEYVYTSVWYGSFSGCDTLQGIQCLSNSDLPEEQQVEEYLMLCLHLLENCHYLGDTNVYREHNLNTIFAKFKDSVDNLYKVQDKYNTQYEYDIWMDALNTFMEHMDKIMEDERINDFD